MPHREVGATKTNEDRMEPRGVRLGPICCDAQGNLTGNDPWKHRSQGMRCRTCMWFAEKAGYEPVDYRGSFGRCRRHAPTMSGYPAVFGLDWCGDHKLDETKI